MRSRRDDKPCAARQDRLLAVHCSQQTAPKPSVSKKKKYNHKRDPFSNHHISCDASDDDGIGIELEAGGALFFCYGTAHCTKKNNSNEERAGLALHFLNSQYIPEINLEFNKPKRVLPLILGNKASGGLKEYGEVGTGTWKDEVNKIIM